MKQRAAADQLPFFQTPGKVLKVALPFIIFITIIQTIIDIDSILPANFHGAHPTTLSQATVGTSSISLDDKTPSGLASKPNKDAEIFETRRKPQEGKTKSSGSSLEDMEEGQELVTQKGAEGTGTVQVQKDPNPTVEGNTHEPRHEIEIEIGRYMTDPEEESSGEESCDLFSWEWVPDPEGPYYYTNDTCNIPVYSWNCMAQGRPSMDYLKWMWKPDACQLPRFDPKVFLELVRGKSMAFVGDSLAGNQISSLICLLSSSNVSQPLYFPANENEKPRNSHWIFRDYNVNLSLLWTPYFVRSESKDPNQYNDVSLYLDELDDHGWTSQVEGYSYIVISGGQWFFKPHMVYENGTLIGCYKCEQENVTQLTAFNNYEIAARAAFRFINSLQSFDGVTFVRTISPAHFEGGGWNDGGDCPRTRPFKRDETAVYSDGAEMYRRQMQEFKVAQEQGSKSKRGLRFRLLDVTQTMWLRPDAHPSRYGHPPNQNLPSDCLHWCLPGPIDTLNQFLLELLRRERVKT